MRILLVCSLLLAVLLLPPAPTHAQNNCDVEAFATRLTELLTDFGTRLGTIADQETQDLYTFYLDIAAARMEFEQMEVCPGLDELQSLAVRYISSFGDYAVFSMMIAKDPLLTPDFKDEFDVIRANQEDLNQQLVELTSQ